MSDSELRGGSPRLCWLRTDRLALGYMIDYVLAHTRFMGSRKLSSFDDHRVGRSLTTLVVMYTGIVYGPPTDSPACGIMWKTCTRKSCDPARLFDRCHELWPLMVLAWLTCVMLSGCYLARLYWFESPWHPRIWVMLVRYYHSIEVPFHYVHMRFIVMFNYDYLVVENDDTKNGWLSYHACLAYVANLLLLINLSWLITWLKVISSRC
jgi:hypothetical protein